ncbi:peptidyl-prolyl cis-trans isomerase [Paenibacillus ihumii]|uniref:peptidyl-prolyl cis-trans isomerase n=1 Tax=Paenibacillus ihumii TaxID=687436 RepID=UPI000A787885|nr:peptidylprolyl isomerase [Paenibacillus ihumii]
MEDKDKKEQESLEEGSGQEKASEETGAVEGTSVDTTEETSIETASRLENEDGAEVVDEAALGAAGAGEKADTEADAEAGAEAGAEAKVDAEADGEADAEADADAQVEPAVEADAQAKETAGGGTAPEADAEDAAPHAEAESNRPPEAEAAETSGRKEIVAPPYAWNGQAAAGDGMTPAASKSSNAWPIISLILAVGLVIALVYPLIGSKKDVVATVNGTKITQDELYDELVKASGGEQAKQALEAMITKALITQEAKKKKIVVTEEDINAEIDNYTKSFGSLEVLEQMLQQYGMTLDDLKQEAELNVMITKLLEDKTNVTDEEIKETFEMYKESFDTPEQVRTSVILVETEAEANDIIQQLKDGKDFAELAKDKSLDTFTKGSGGDTGFFERGQVEPAVEEAAFKLQKDEISGAVKTNDGYKVIKLTDRKEAKEATLEDSKDEIRKGLVSQQISELFGDWLNEVKSGAKITNKLTNPDTAHSGSASNPAVS